MISTVQQKRLNLLHWGLVGVFLLLGLRLVDLQVLRFRELTGKAADNTRFTHLLEPRRGDILDRNGELLATSTFVKKICADPTFLDPHQEQVAKALAPILKESYSDLAHKLRLRVYTNEVGKVRTNRYVVLKRKASEKEWLVVSNAMHHLDLGGNPETDSREELKAKDIVRKSSVFVDRLEEQERIYPNGSLASHVLGYVQRGFTETVSGRVETLVGGSGVEATFNEALMGFHGWRSGEKDRRSRELVPYRTQNVGARDGLRLVLTLDSRIQAVVEQELEQAMDVFNPVGCSAIVVQPKTGEILAMANLPTFDPNRPAEALIPGMTPEQIVAARRNSAVSDMAEPGSTFKIVVVSGALNERLTTLSDSFDCEGGRFYFAGKRLDDHDPYGILSVEQIITKSSNIGSAKIGILIGEQNLYHYMRDFGFGSRTGIPLLGEAKGLMADPSHWTKLSISRIPMGHEVAVTPLQMVMAMCAIANQGQLLRPKIVDRLVDANGEVVAEYPVTAVRQVVAPWVAMDMVKALKTVVGRNGTGNNAKLEHYTVAGKTGTAQKVVNGRYPDGKYYSSFIGFFPADDPQICISVIIDEPRRKGYYGGVVAAPVFKKIAEKAAVYLGIPPEPVGGKEWLTQRGG